MPSSMTPRKLKSTVRYTARPAVPVTKSAPVPAPVSVDKITAALDKLTVEQTKTTSSIAPVAAPAKTIAAQRIEERRRRVADKISKKPADVKRIKNKSAQSSVAGSKRSTPATSAATSRSVSFSTVDESPANDTDSSVTTVVPASTRQYGYVYVDVKDNFRQNAYRGIYWRKAHTSELVNFSHSVFCSESRIPAFPTDDFLHVRRQARITPGSTRVWLDVKPLRSGVAAWDPTPAEADVTDPKSPGKQPRRPGLKVSFADKLISSTRFFDKWYLDTWQGGWPEQEGPYDDSEEPIIDAAPISTINETTSTPPEDNTARSKDDLDAIWDSAMATKFDDESDSESECNDSAKPEEDQETLRKAELLAKFSEEKPTVQMKEAIRKARLLAKFSEAATTDDEFF